jgi:hypothetical protein
MAAGGGISPVPHPQVHRGWGFSATPLTSFLSLPMRLLFVSIAEPRLLPFRKFNQM